MAVTGRHMDAMPVLEQLMSTPAALEEEVFAQDGLVEDVIAVDRTTYVSADGWKYGNGLLWI